MSLSFRTICERMRAHAIYVGEGLQFPCASELEIQACEARLGFSLPPMLRELYMTVANGSDFFREGYSFSTISSKFVGHGSGYPVLGEIVGDGPRPFDDATVDALRTHPGAYVVCESLPAGLVDFVSLGCEVRAHLDGFTGHIYISDNHSTDGELDGIAFSFGASSLEEWLERWLADAPSMGSEWRYQPHEPLSVVLAGSADEDSDGEDRDSAPWKHLRLRYESPVASFRKRMLTGLEKTRMELTRQIYDLDEIQRGVVVSSQGQSRRDEQYITWELSSYMQQLADLEAQLDALICDARIIRS